MSEGIGGAAAWRIGVDIGGTFTDVVAVSGEGEVVMGKAFTTPEDLSQGVFAALGEVASRAGATTAQLLARTVRLAHGTTVSTNALIQRKGARVGLVTTSGFEDTWAIGRGPVARTGGLPPRQAMDFVHTEAPPPLVPRSRIRGIAERVGAGGEVLLAPRRTEVEGAVRELLELGVESLAVVLLWSFRRPDHERLVAEVAREIAPDLPVSLSSEIAPRLGEFERVVTTGVNAYVAPLTHRYLRSLDRRLMDLGLQRPLQVMTASGGLIEPAEVDRRAVSLINSGPVGGVVAGSYLGDLMEKDHLITADMGGTSFDVGIVAGGHWQVDPQPHLAHGLPGQVEAVRIATIGAGGGSIAWTDGHRLYVGPQSAGSVPGPVAYGRGGTHPTVTDALLSLGFLHPDRFFGGRFSLQRTAAQSAIAEQIAQPLGLTVEDAASGIYEVVTATMADLIRKVTIEQGHDPRRFSLVAFGGAAGCHAAVIADRLRIPEVIIPHAAPVFSAFGIALSDVRYEASQSVPLSLFGDWAGDEVVDEAFRQIVARVESGLGRSGVPSSQAQWRYAVDVRYLGQLSALTVPWPKPGLAAQEIGSLREAFEALYERKFGKGSTRGGSPLELMAVRAQASVPSPRPGLRPRSVRERKDGAERRSVYLRGQGLVESTVVAYACWGPGQAVAGPAVVERDDTTIWVPPGHEAEVDEVGNVRVRRRAEGG